MVEERWRRWDGGEKEERTRKKAQKMNQQKQLSLRKRKIEDR